MFFLFFTEPRIRSTLPEVTGETTEDTIALIYTESTIGEFDHYLFTCNGSSNDVIKKKSDDDRKVKFTGLTAGVRYGVTAHTVSGIEKSNENVYKAIVTSQLLLIIMPVKHRYLSYRTIPAHAYV